MANQQVIRIIQCILCLRHPDIQNAWGGTMWDTPPSHFGNSHGSPLTNAGLDHLARLPNLKELRLLRTKITPTGLARFRAAPPECQVTTDLVESR